MLESVAFLDLFNIEKKFRSLDKVRSRRVLKL